MPPPLVPAAATCSQSSGFSRAPLALRTSRAASRCGQWRQKRGQRIHSQPGVGRHTHPPARPPTYPPTRPPARSLSPARTSSLRIPSQPRCPRRRGRRLTGSSAGRNLRDLRRRSQLDARLALVAHEWSARSLYPCNRAVARGWPAQCRRLEAMSSSWSSPSTSLGRCRWPLGQM